MPNDITAPEAPAATTMILTFEQKCKELQAEVTALRAEKEAETAALAQDLASAKQRIVELEKKNADLLKKVKATRELPEGDYASWKGEIYPIVGDFRADNTFHHVKTRDCDEGLTLLAIPRPH